jgi:hypothetical protein
VRLQSSSLPAQRALDITEMKAMRRRSGIASGKRFA